VVTVVADPRPRARARAHGRVVRRRRRAPAPTEHRGERARGQAGHGPVRRDHVAFQPDGALGGLRTKRKTQNSQHVTYGQRSRPRLSGEGGGERLIVFNPLPPTKFQRTIFYYCARQQIQ